MAKRIDIGVTTWSFRIPEVKFEEILRTIKVDTQLHIIQVGAFGKLELTKKVQEKWLEALTAYDFEVAATCVAFNGEDYSSVEAAIATVGFYDPKYLQVRFKHLCDMAELTSALGVNKLTTHLGFIPHETSKPKYQHMLDVTKRIAGVLGEKGINFGLEVGGLETAEDLLRFIQLVDHKNVKINFDPANLVRTGIDDPIEALGVLREHVMLVHLKDAIPPTEKGLFGDMVALGQGAIQVERFIEKLKEIDYQGPLLIEGEGGYDTVAHVCNARDLLRSLL